MNGARPAPTSPPIRTYPCFQRGARLCNTLYCTASKTPFHEPAEPTNDGIVHAQDGGRDRAIEPDFGESRVPDDKTVGLGLSRGNQARGRTDDGPALKEYMSSTRSLGLFLAGDIRSIV